MHRSPGALAAILYSNLAELMQRLQYQ